MSDVEANSMDGSRPSVLEVESRESSFAGRDCGRQQMDRSKHVRRKDFNPPSKPGCVSDSKQKTP
eukprot:scaffold70129_cov23-Prasinocladus_malaysianus.AAC.1